MSYLDNAFRVLASEHINSESIFLRLFAPGVLEVLSKENIWTRIQILRSASGGGKTSLLRLFTPESLTTLYDFRQSSEYKELFGQVSSLGVISEEGVSLLGIKLSCGGNISSLEDLNFSRGHKNRLFFSLLNSRITLAALISALALKKLPFDDLQKISVSRPRTSDLPNSVPVPCDGRTLYSWAANLEKKVSDMIDSFDSPDISSLEGHDSLYSLLFLQPSCIKFEGQPLAEKTLVMIDDIHKVTASQRRILLDNVLTMRPPLGLWLAERFEALTPKELLDLGATEGRDFDVIGLEDYWRNDPTKRFEQMLTEIAERRASLNNVVQAGTFVGSVRSSLDGIQWQIQFSDALSTVSQRVSEKCHSTKRYDEWIQQCEGNEGTVREKLINWRVLEIKIERDIRKGQKQLFDIPLTPEEVEKQEGSALKEAAELLVSKEFHMPYYYGFSQLAKLSSSNIEQFLILCGDLFDEITASFLLRKSTVLAPDRQEDILLNAAKAKWDLIRKYSPYSSDVVLILEFIRKLCQSETNRPNAPYAPGVTGVAIPMDEREKLIDPDLLKRRPDYDRLSRALYVLISNNILETSLFRSQGKKGGRTWMLLYINRLLCLLFGLPLQYGGWRPLTIGRLSSLFESENESIVNRGLT